MSANQTSAKLNSRQHYRSLDGLRGCALLMIFAYHYVLSTHSSGRLVTSLVWISRGGWTGVDLFFALSGFLITGILLDTVDHHHFFRNFYARRTLRIFPLFYGVFVLLLLLTPVLHLRWHWGNVAYFLYVGNVMVHVFPQFNNIEPAVRLTHFWSLAVEEQFYLVWPLTVLATHGGKRLVRTALWIMLCALALRMFLLWWLPPDAAYEAAYFELPTHCESLLCGSIVAALVRERSLHALRRSGWIALGCGSAATGALIAWNRSMNYKSYAMTLGIYPAVGVVCASVVLLALVPGTVFQRFGELRPLRFVGRYSYGMYVYHLLFLPLLLPLLPHLQHRLGSEALGGALFVLGVFTTTALIAIASYELYEKRFLAWKKLFPYDRAPAA